MKTIIDISHHQKDFPWDTVKGEIDFVIVRPSHGMNDTDKEWADNLAWLKAHPDEKFAVYHYFYYKEAAKHSAELNNFLKHIRPLLTLKNFTGMAFLDFEHPSDVGTERPIAACPPTVMTDYLVKDCQILIKEGFVPGLYASRDWLRFKMEPQRFPLECVIWLAHYTQVPGKTDYPYRWDIHQYSSTGKLETTNLFAGALDMDYINPKTGFVILRDIIEENVVRLIQRGDSGILVRDIQQILKDRAYSVAVDGDFGPNTELGVKAFQKDNGLYIDGVVGPQTWDALHSVREFSLARDGHKLVREDCPNFYVREFACRDGSDKILICLTNVKNLQKERNHRKKAMIINSGYRTETYNESDNVRGEKNSLHTKGYATDFYFAGISPFIIFAALTLTHKGGLGKYRTFTHMDSGRNRRWVG